MEFILTQLPVNSLIITLSIMLIKQELSMLLKLPLTVLTSIRNSIPNSTVNISQWHSANTHLLLLMMMAPLWSTLPSSLATISHLVISILVEQENSISMYTQVLLEFLMVLVLFNLVNSSQKQALSISFSSLMGPQLCATRHDTARLHDNSTLFYITFF